jgi:hypothetical protein
MRMLLLIDPGSSANRKLADHFRLLCDPTGAPVATPYCRRPTRVVDLRLANHDTLCYFALGLPEQARTLTSSIS